MNCKNCGAKLSEVVERCPYCGTMNAKGALKGYRKRLYQLKDHLFFLKDDAYDSLWQMILASLIKAFVLIVLCILIGGGLGMIGTPGYEDADYEKEAYEKVVWREENKERLDTIYRTKDIDAYRTLRKEEDDNYNIFDWEHYDIMELYENGTFFLEMSEEYKDQDYKAGDHLYTISRGLSLLYAPEHLVNIHFDEEEAKEYETLQKEIQDGFALLGFDNEDTMYLFERSKDEYGMNSVRLEEVLLEVAK